MELLPDKLHQLRWTLNQKAKNEPKFGFYALYDRIYRMDVLEAACKHDGKRGKSCGIDGVKAEDILDKEGGVELFLDTIHEELKSKSYCPSPVKRVYIAKANGKKRPLGIATLKDRVVQMAVVLILDPILEADFCDCSYGFRPGRKAQDALETIRKNLRLGRTEIYDADLNGYFDSIPHDKLMAGYQGARINEWINNCLEPWLELSINGEKTSEVKLKRGESLDFLWFTFRYDRDLHGRDKDYLNVFPSKKSQKKARQAIGEATGPQKCFKRTPAIVKELNTYLKGWCSYFQNGYPRKTFGALGHSCYQRMTTHLNRRSQGNYHRPKVMSNYQYLQSLGLYRP
jgi:hypothetical protein